MKLVFHLLLSFWSLQIHAQSKNIFILKGEIIGQDSGYLHIGYKDKNGSLIEDSCAIKGNQFLFKGYISEPTESYFFGNVKSQSIDDPNSTYIFLEPLNMQAVFKINNFKHAKIIGSKSQEEYSKLVLKHDSIQLKWKTVLDAFWNARANNEMDKSETIREQQMRPYFDDIAKVDFHFISNHPDSYVSAYLLQFQKLEFDSLNLFFSRLTQRVQQSRTGKQILEKINKQEKVVNGKQAPAFTQVDIEGNKVSLKDFKGKYVLLNFWASWCEPCRRENIELTKIYNQYKDQRFAIISISLDETEDSWKSAVIHDSLKWIQVSDLKGWQNIAAQEYNVHELPANFLIDPDGKIIASNLHEKDLKEKLIELLE